MYALLNKNVIVLWKQLANNILYFAIRRDAQQETDVFSNNYQFDSDLHNVA